MGGSSAFGGPTPDQQLRGTGPVAFDASIARDSELSFANLSGTLSDPQIPASITRDSELSFGNLSGSISDGQVPGSFTRDVELAFANLSGQIADGQIPASIARDIEIPAVITDHGVLGGLGDDDHPQYLLEDGSRAMSGELNMNGNNVTNVGSSSGVGFTVSDHETRITALEGEGPANFSDLEGEIASDQIPIPLKPLAFGILATSTGCGNWTLERGYNIASIPATDDPTVLVQDLPVRVRVVIIFTELHSDGSGGTERCFFGDGQETISNPNGDKSVQIAQCNASTYCNGIANKQLSFVLFAYPY